MSKPKPIDKLFKKKAAKVKLNEKTGENAFNILNDLNDMVFFSDTMETKEEPTELEDTEPYLPSYRKYCDDFINKDIVIEPILSKTSSRFAVHPIVFEKIWDLYKLQLQNNWTVEEVDLAKDVDDWEHLLNHNDRIFLMHVLAFFASADGIVNANIKENIIDHITIKEAECAYSKQFEMENAHGEMYSLMIDTYIGKNGVLKNKLFNSIKTMPAMKKKTEWCMKWIKSDKPFCHKMLAFAIVEGIFFSGSFASIFWLKLRKGNPMVGLIKSNQFIARDEAIHVKLAVAIYELLKNRIKQSVVNEMIKEAVEIEKEFINYALKCDMIGMSSKLMSTYIEYVSDQLLVQFGYNKLYNVDNPLEYMNKIGMNDKVNFFEARNTAYLDGKVNNPRIFRRASLY